MIHLTLLASLFLVPASYGEHHGYPPPYAYSCGWRCEQERQEEHWRHWRWEQRHEEREHQWCWRNPDACYPR